MGFMRTVWLVSVVLAVVSLPAEMMAQAGSSTVTGLVTDASGGAIPGATVNVINEATGVAPETVTNNEGQYSVPALVPGRYRIEAKIDGFETTVRRIVLAVGQTSSVDMTLTPARFTEGVIVTARRVEEVAQEVPIPVSVVSGNLVADSGAFNVNRLKEMIPTVQFYSSNPRNSAINIRGLGAPFGLTNDGIEPGVGLYIDGAFFARPAAATLDFLDVEQVEVLRGPQGTLFGKNTTAGAINVTTRKPSFNRESNVELNYGSLGLVQAKASVTGPLFKKAAGRISFSGTTRDGTITNTVTGADLNGLNNLGVRGQLLFAPSDKIAMSGVGRPHAPAPGRPRTGRRRRRADAAARESTVRANRRRPGLHPAEFQRVRPADRYQYGLAVAPGPRRRLADHRLEAWAGPAELDHRVALLGLASFERSRLHRPACDDDLGRHIEAAAMDAGSPLRRGRFSADELCRRRILFPPGGRFGPGHQTGTGRGCGALSARAERAGGDTRPSRRIRV